MIVARRFLLSGRVQRVGLRWFTVEAARRENLSGWVCNLPDGRVEVMAEGESEALERFERIIRQGPPAARVDEVETEIQTPTGRHVGFSGRQ